ncbi:MAG: tyrosine-protein phosphatase [Betaproteobacteria bacterium]|nr:tyrosine-protein phosphatase [Paracoccaceae bacterium]MBD3813685.1 tyrosine-protein phosphatase [Betaproteobacteria bacterium]
MTAIIALLAMVGAYLGALQIFGNFQEVLPGEYYRSAQVTPGRLAEYQEAVGIRSVVNLRGQNRGSSWYDEELKASERLGIAHFDFRMSASRPFSKEQALELLALLRSVPKPVLIHCQGGADRSGLASALYLAAITRADEPVAERQISIRYGHIGIPYLSATYAMDESWETLEPWLGFGDS